MSIEQKMFLIVVAVLAIGLVVFFAFRRPKWREELGDTADLDPPRRVGRHPALGAGYRQGPILRYPAKHTVTIRLNARHLEHVNIQRRAAGKQPMNNLGFRSAIAAQATASAPLHSSSDWMTYLIAYEVLSADHHSSRVYVDTGGITITPDAPFNGLGGSYSGAGATSSFDPYEDISKVATQGLAYGSAGGFAAALGAGAVLSGADPGPLHDGSLPPPGGASYSGNDPQWSKPAVVPEPAPEPQAAPEPEQAAPEPQQAPDPPSSGGGTND